MRTKLSTCRRKHVYSDEAAAIAAAEAADLPLRPYRCDRCRHVHLTSRTKNKWMPLKAR